MKSGYFILTFCCLIVFESTSWSQTKGSPIKESPAKGSQKKDSLVVLKKDSVLYISSAKTASDTAIVVDSLKLRDSLLAKKRHLKQFDPHKATLYSTFFPGLGQIYNRKYWKLPLVYAGVGIPAYFYFSNKSQYKLAQYALVVLATSPGQFGDTTASWRDSLNKVDKNLKPYITYLDDNDLRSWRNQVRKYQDYSVLFFILFWGLNIVDATVDAHLRGFDVGTELSIHIAPSAPGTPAGMGLVFDLHPPKFRSIHLP